MALAGIIIGSVNVLVMGVGLVVFVVAIAAPNFFEAQTRAKVAKTQAEIRNIATALESYYIDNEAYPPAIGEDGALKPYDPEQGLVSSGEVPYLLTTPVACLSSLLHDPFAPEDASTPFRYATDGEEWILVGRGPDKVETLTIEEFPVEGVEYDTTNGTTSQGDLFRRGP